MPVLVFQSLGAAELLIVLIFWVVPIWATTRVAKDRGRNPWLWGMAGVLFPILALIVVALLPRGPTAYTH